MPVQTEIEVTSRLSTGTSFAVVVDTGETVFIPARTAERVNIQVGDTRLATVIENRKLRDHPDAAKLFALWVSPPVPPVCTPPVPQPTSDEFTQDDVRHFVMNSDEVWTVDLLCRHFGAVDDADRQRVANAVANGHEKGLIARAYITAHARQARPSRAVYAASVEMLEQTLGL